MAGRYTELLNQKLDILTKIFEATKRLKITGEGSEEEIEQEISHFSSLYEQRADLIKRIQKIDEEITALINNGSADSKEAADIINKIKKAAKGTADLDKKYMEVSAKFSAFVKSNLKKIRDGRDMSSAYSDTDMYSQSGNYFDKTH